MRRPFLLILLILIAPPVLAQTGIAVRLRSNADCENLACVAAGQVCVTGETIYCCDTVGGNFDPCGSASPANAALVDFANVFTALQTIGMPSGSATALVLDRDSQTVNAGIAMDLHLDNSAGTSTRYARVVGEIVDPDAGNEDGSLAFSTRLNGTTAFKMRLDENGNLVFLTAGATVDGKNLDNAAMEDEANVFTLANRFSAGAFADAGQQIGFEGSAGDTYQKRDADLSSLESTLDGTRGWSLIGGVLQPPPCPADLNAAPPGFCHDEATGDIVLVGTLRTHP